MGDAARVMAKVLMLDGDDACAQRIQNFCEQNNLLVQRVHVNNFVEALEANVDLSGIFLSEGTGNPDFDGLTLGRLIQRSRAELPIFLRRAVGKSADELSPAAARPFAQVYSIDNIDTLQSTLASRVFSFVYPQALVQGLINITKTALESQFVDMHADTETPYIVLDKLIFGEIFTLIQVETGWCRGYMMLQVEEEALEALVTTSHTHARLEHAHDFRNLNGILNEVTNLIWGGFKNKYGTSGVTERSLSQVPLVINPGRQHISFGSDNPQLCLKHTLVNRADTKAVRIVVYQKFVFNMNWNPDDFRENESPADEIHESGELELF